MTKTTSTRGTTGRRRVSQVHARKATAKRPGSSAVGQRRAKAGSPRARRSPKPKRSSRAKGSQQASRATGSAGAPAGNRRLLATLFQKARFGIGRQTHDVVGVCMALAGLLIALAFFEAAGPLGDWTLRGLRVVVGVWVYITPVLLVALGGSLVVGRHHDGFQRVLVGVVLWFVGSLALFHLLTGGQSLAGNIDRIRQSGGALGSLVAYPLNRLLGFAGAFLVISLFMAAGVMLMVRATVRDVVVAAAELVTYLGRAAKARLTAPPDWRRRSSQGGKRRDAARERARATRPRKPPQRPPPRPSQSQERGGRPTQADGAGSNNKRQARPSPPPAAEGGPPRLRVVPSPEPPSRPTGKSDYRLPPIDLLKTGGREGQSRRMLEETARQLEETLHHHDVNAQLTNIVPGPTVTRYEIELAPGVKVSRVTNLAGDIAYALATPDVRLLAPIPGRSAIGVEVPNRVRRLVTLGDVLTSADVSMLTHPLVVGLGEDISGQPVLLNLAELPHVLIAGATGAGKSSCINSIVTSLLALTEPDDVRLIMVDPKRVELSQYNGVPHLLTRVITKPKKAVDALQWAVAEMDRRYGLLAEAGVRDIVGYRAAFDSGRLEDGSFDRFPYLVILIDELNDLMMVAGRDVESAVVRIAQMARAVGIHLVIATQRPSVNVITGVIKANVPSRLAFSVASPDRLAGDHRHRGRRQAGGYGGHAGGDRAGAPSQEGSGCMGERGGDRCGGGVGQGSEGGRLPADRRRGGCGTPSLGRGR